MLKTLQVWTGTFVTLDATGALTTPSVGPVGTLYVAGVANAAAVTISGSNPYKFSVTLPALIAGQSVEMYVTATIAGIATSALVDKDIGDTVALSDLATPTNITAGTINSVSGTVTANVTQIDGETTPVDNLVLALGTGGLVEKLNSMLEAAGLAYRFTAAALAEAPTESGTGTGTYTDTIKDPSDNPLDGVRVQLSTDDVGSNRVYQTYTNALGVFTMNPDPGTYYRWLDLADYDFAQGVAVVVT